MYQHLGLNMFDQLSAAALVRNRPSNTQGSAMRTPSPASVAFIHQFPDNPWLENLAIRPTGQVLVTTLTSADHYLVDSLKTWRSALIRSLSNHTDK